MGGFHLRDTNRNAIEKIISILKELNVYYIGPCHCTGELARSLFKSEFGEYYIDVGVGKKIFIKNLE